MAQLLSDIDNPLEIVLENEPDSIEKENKGYLFRIFANEITLVSGNICESELEQAPSVALGEGKKSLSLLDVTHGEELAHPHLFPT